MCCNIVLGQHEIRAEHPWEVGGPNGGPQGSAAPPQGCGPLGRGEGQQALEDAETLGLPFTFASNGTGLAFHDRTAQAAYPAKDPSFWSIFPWGRGQPVRASGIPWHLNLSPPFIPMGRLSAFADTEMPPPGKRQAATWFQSELSQASCAGADRMARVSQVSSSISASRLVSRAVPSWANDRSISASGSTSARITRPHRAS